LVLVDFRPREVVQGIVRIEANRAQEQPSAACQQRTRRGLEGLHDGGG
jgi:hypothetical protein